MLIRFSLLANCFLEDHSGRVILSFHKMIHGKKDREDRNTIRCVVCKTGTYELNIDELRLVFS